MLESPEERGKATRFVKELGIHPPKKRGTMQRQRKGRLSKGRNELWTSLRWKNQL